MVFKNIVTKRTYVKDGEEKTTWLQVGTLKELDDGKQFIELNIFPETSFYVFAKEERNQSNVAPTTTAIDEDIPF
jgi:hypothetical protein